MGWQRRSSGYNYASLSEHGFLIGVHPRRVIACVVFSKKCIICENRRKCKVTVVSPTVSAKTPATPSVTEVLPSASSIIGAVTEVLCPSVSTVSPLVAMVYPSVTEVLCPSVSTLSPLVAIVYPSVTEILCPSVYTVILDLEDSLEEADDIIGIEDLDEDVDEDNGVTGVLDMSGLDLECTINYDGSSRAMESDGLLIQHIYQNPTGIQTRPMEQNALPGRFLNSSKVRNRIPRPTNSMPSE